MDRRVQKTKRLLSQALLDLILEKGYENVTVQDILDKANVGRSTFYVHYENKELLLLDGPRNLGFSLFGKSDGAPPRPSSDHSRMKFRDLFQHVSENLPLAKATLGKNGGNAIIESFRNQIEEAIRDHYKDRFSRSKKEKLMLTYLSRSAAAAVICLLASWIDDNLSLTVEEISDRCGTMIKAILSQD